VLEVRREQRRIAGEEARDTSLLTPEEIALIENSRYFENGEFNEEAILENFQIFVQNTLTRREDASQI